MAGQDIVTFQGTLQAGPPRSGCPGFPSGLVNIAFQLRPSAKAAAVHVAHVKNLATASPAYDELDVGPDADVTQATFLFVRTETSILLRITTDDGSGGDVVAVVPVQGLFAMEAPTNRHIKLLEAQGTGTIEYFASGNQ